MAALLGVWGSSLESTLIGPQNVITPENVHNSVIINLLSIKSRGDTPPLFQDSKQESFIGSNWVMCLLWIILENIVRTESKIHELRAQFAAICLKKGKENVCVYV